MQLLKRFLSLQIIILRHKEDYMSESKTNVIKDVEFNWANVFTPKSPFGALQWDIQVVTYDAAKAEELKAAGINLKKDGNKFFGNVKRKTVSAKGTPLSKPIVKGLEEGQSIGNGSKGNLKVFTYDYNVSGRKGTSAMLVGVNITELVEYNSSNNEDF